MAESGTECPAKKDFPLSVAFVCEKAGGSATCITTDTHLDSARRLILQSMLLGSSLYLLTPWHVVME